MQSVIFTDGASKGNPGRGGFGVVVVWDGQVTELGGREDNVSNNNMELRGAIEALKFARKKSLADLLIYSDSKYVINGITAWIFAWKRNGWKTKAGEPVANIDLWKDLSELALGLKIKWEYTGGHVGIVGNERVDAIASDFAEGKKVELYSGPLETYGKDILNITKDETAHEAKSAARSKSKLRAYSYVSEVDGVVKTHKTWSECEDRVKGKNARYKKAISSEDEINIIEKFSS